MSGRQNKPIPLARAIAPHLARVMRRFGSAKVELEAHWTRIVGEEFSELASFLRFTGTRLRPGTLYLSATPSARLLLEHRVPTLRARINEYFGYPCIDRIVIRPRS